jgi:hypothetical protein
MMVCQGFSFHFGGTQRGVRGLVCQHIRQTSDLYLEDKDEHCKITPKNHHTTKLSLQDKEKQLRLNLIMSVKICIVVKL